MRSHSSMSGARQIPHSVNISDDVMTMTMKMMVMLMATSTTVTRKVQGGQPRLDVSESFPGGLTSWPNRGERKALAPTCTQTGAATDWLPAEIAMGVIPAL